MKNYEIHDKKRHCKTLFYGCLNENVECVDCKFVKFENDKFSVNYTHFDDENICRSCGGSKQLIVPKWTQKGMKEDDIFPCWDCEKTGKQTYSLRNQILSEKHRSEGHYKDYRELQEFIKKTSTCIKCHGNQMSTLGGGVCEECGLPGKCPWPG